MSLQLTTAAQPKLDLLEPESAERPTRCPACNRVDCSDFFSVGGLPVHVGIFFPDADSARNSDVGDITLTFCHRCGHVFNRAFDSRKINYRPGYEVALNHSPVFRTFMTQVAERLIDRFDLHRKKVFEIGVGCGYFLNLLCEMGTNKGCGIDPTVPSEGYARGVPGEVELIRGVFDESFADQFQQINPDFVCCLSVLEHIEQPSRMLRALRSMIGRRSVAIYFEIFNAARAFKTGEVWSIHYEQCNYFSEQSFREVFLNNGYRVVDCGSCYCGDQYLYVDAVATSQADASVAGNDLAALDCGDGQGRLSLPDDLRDFDFAFRRRQDYWRERLSQLRSSGEKVVFWGTGGKGISFLNLLHTADVIPFVAETNPQKHGKYVPGVGSQIVPPAFLAQYQPDEIILSNVLYEDEIKRQAAELGIHCRFSIA